MRKFITFALAALMVVATLPALPLIPALARQSDATTVPLWRGQETAGGSYIIGPGTGVQLYYYWFAATDEQVQDFIDHATFAITINGTPAFQTPLEAAQWWGEIEDFDYYGKPIRRARWFYRLPDLDPGRYAVITDISIDTALEDGVATQPFQPGTLHHTTNVLNILGAGFSYADAIAAQQANTRVPIATQPGVVTDSAAAPATTPVPAATAAPAVAPRDTWVPRQETYARRVMGTFVANSEAYYYPEASRLVAPRITFTPGMTLWVYGLDPTRQYYMVILDEAYLWVRVGTIGPTQDSVWNGTPLPGVIIDPDS